MQTKDADANENKKREAHMLTTIGMRITLTAAYRLNYIMYIFATFAILHKCEGAINGYHRNRQNWITVTCLTKKQAIQLCPENRYVRPRYIKQ